MCVFVCVYCVLEWEFLQASDLILVEMGFFFNVEEQIHDEDSVNKFKT